MIKNKSETIEDLNSVITRLDNQIEEFKKIIDENKTIDENKELQE
ncbi:hypothetical protein [Gottschalkia purinilytica]|nr:hypothetical protein [Gottschalkia purinilytica]